MSASRTLTSGYAFRNSVITGSTWRRPNTMGTVRTRSPLGARYSPETRRSASSTSSRIRLHAVTYACPASVSASLRVERTKSFALTCDSSWAILRLTVGTGMRRSRAAPEKLPASTTATSTDMDLKRSMIIPYFGNIYLHITV